MAGDATFVTMHKKLMHPLANVPDGIVTAPMRVQPDGKLMASLTEVLDEL